jgi:multiple sugar transport system ATP-binding protein
MSSIKLHSVVKKFGSFEAIKDLNIEIENGKFTVLVGPSGCGKSTLLRLIAGLESVTEGNIEIGTRVVNDVPPKGRNIAMVFQNYALYPHMTVAENMSFALRLRKLPKDTIEAAVDEAAKTLGIGTYLNRIPAKLSGGQRQRVAMGRAIVRDPEVFLFDEPLSNLDAALRVHMRKEIRALHDRLGATSVYVTHDQIEAMTMADHVVVMRNGFIEQQGDPLYLYDRPVNRFVAGFIGSPAMNFVDCRVSSDGQSIVLDLGQTFQLRLATKQEPNRSLTIGLRPEHLHIVPEGTENSIGVPVRVLESTGSISYITTASEPELTVVINGRTSLRAGNMVYLGIDPEFIHVFDPDSGLAV